MSEVRSPRIVSLTWGRLETDNGHIYSDAILYPGGGTHWDWELTGTRHVPGIQVSDIEEMLHHGAKVVVLSLGHYKRLKVSPQTLQVLEQHGVDVHILQTDEAMKVYNQLAETEMVGGVFHTTC